MLLACWLPTPAALLIATAPEIPPPAIVPISAVFVLTLAFSSIEPLSTKVWRPSFSTAFEPATSAAVDRLLPCWLPTPATLLSARLPVISLPPVREAATPIVAVLSPLVCSLSEAPVSTVNVCSNTNRADSERPEELVPVELSSPFAVAVSIPMNSVRLLNASVADLPLAVLDSEVLLLVELLLLELSVLDAVAEADPPPPLAELPPALALAPAKPLAEALLVALLVELDVVLLFVEKVNEGSDTPTPATPIGVATASAAAPPEVKVCVNCVSEKKMSTSTLVLVPSVLVVLVEADCAKAGAEGAANAKPAPATMASAIKLRNFISFPP
jgi:hypothetical protein